MGIIALLLGALTMVGRSVITKGQVREAQTLLIKLDMAAQEFADDAPLSKVPNYKSRYGDYPPDELDGFLLSARIPRSSSTNTSQGHIAPGGADLVVPSNISGVANADIKAFTLACRLYSTDASAHPGYGGQ